MSRRAVPVAERLWAKVEKTESCWLWTGAASAGYGRIRADTPSRLMLLAHRVAYEIEHGPAPEGAVIDHRCHQTMCVRPDHLRAVTSKQNAEHAAGPSRNNKSGHLGVYQSYPGRWRGKVKHLGRAHYTPTFATPDEAAEAIRQLRLSLFTHNDADRNAS